MRKLLLAITVAALAVGAFVIHGHWVKSRTLPTVSFTIVNYPEDLNRLKNEFKDEHRTVVVLETGKDCGDFCDDAEAQLATHAAAHPNLRIVKVYYEPSPFVSIGYVLPSVWMVVPGYGITFAGSMPNKHSVDAFLDHRAAMGSKEAAMLKNIDHLNTQANTIRWPWYLRLRELSEKGSKMTRADWIELRHINKQLDEHAELNGDLGKQLSQAHEEFDAVMHSEAFPDSH